MRNPYTFPLRSRKDITAYLGNHEGYHPMNSWNGGFVLSWNVKVYDADYSGKHGSEPINPVLDEEWEEYTQTTDIFSQACEEASFYLMEGEYTTYPGDDQGSFEFSLNGRSGGHLCLMGCSAVPQPRCWAIAPFVFHDRDHWKEYLSERAFSDLYTLYRAIACMDQDFTQEKVTEEINYHINLYRSAWEQERDKELEERARELEVSRPDMYGVAELQAIQGE